MRILPRSKSAGSVNKNRIEDTFEFIYEYHRHTSTNNTATHRCIYLPFPVLIAKGNKLQPRRPRSKLNADKKHTRTQPNGIYQGYDFGFEQHTPLEHNLLETSLGKTMPRTGVLFGGVNR